MIGAARYAGKKLATPRDFFVWMGKQVDEPPEKTGGGTRYAIERTDAKGKPVYEMWTFMVDNGTVFNAGTSKESGVEMTQGFFRSMKDTPETKELSDDLQCVVPF